MSKNKNLLPYNLTPIEKLIPYANNARTHTPEQVDKIAASIKEFRFINPVIMDGEGGIIAGHGRVLAAKKLGHSHIPTLEASHLTKVQKKAYILADNKLSLEAGWDNQMLKIEIEELQDLGFDLELTGFELPELEDILADNNFSPGGAADQSKLDTLDPKMVNCPHCGKDFDSRGREIE